jgi:hypothetical protein
MQAYLQQAGHPPQHVSPQHSEPQQVVQQVGQLVQHSLPQHEPVFALAGAARAATPVESRNAAPSKKLLIIKTSF